MKKLLIIISIFLINVISAQNQSSIVFSAGTTITVTAPADICANVIIINGNYSGNGTQCGSPLPVELVAFTANIVNKTVQIKWKTATELNNLGFEIERFIQKLPTDLESWEKIGFIEGNGNSSIPKEYFFADRLKQKGKYNYRLKQIDQNGSYTFSNVVQVDYENVLPTEFSLEQNYPNPFNASTIISFSVAKKEFVNISVFNVIGQLVAELINAELEAGTYEINFNSKELPSGLYLYKFKSKSLNVTKKMTLLK